jgi:hypothetical protein
MTFDVLRETQLGQLVGKARSSRCNKVSAIAKALIKRWKLQLKQKHSDGQASEDIIIPPSFASWRAVFKHAQQEEARKLQRAGALVRKRGRDITRTAKSTIKLSLEATPGQGSAKRSRRRTSYTEGFTARGVRLTKTVPRCDIANYVKEQR